MTLRRSKAKWVRVSIALSQEEAAKLDNIIRVLGATGSLSLRSEVIGQLIAHAHRNLEKEASKLDIANPRMVRAVLSKKE
jgi:hypothetical protein